MCRRLISLVSCILVLSVANSACADLVGHWALDEGSGIIAHDSSGSGNDGTINGAQTTAGQIGEALLFDEIDDHVVVPDLAYGPEFTVAFWFKSSGNVGTVYQYMFSHAPYNASNSVNIYFCEDSQTTPGRLRTALRDADDAQNQEGLDVASGFADGNWHHYALTVGSGMGANVYVDGVLQISLASQGGDAFDPGSDLYLGGRVDLNAQRFFGGALDDVRVYNHTLSAGAIQQAMLGVPPGVASDPTPAHEATDVPRDVVLSWTPGEYAPPINGHKVYLSENFNDVNNGIGGIAQDANSYDPGRLNFGTTYYWRVDEVNGAPDYTVFEGEVWQFTTEPIGYPIKNVTATASSAQSADTGPENTVNGSGLDENDLHSKEATDSWLSSVAGAQPTWVQYEFDKVYKLHQIIVWNSNQAVEPMVGFGFKDVTIEYSVNGTDYTTLGTTHEFAQATGATGYAYNTTVDFGGVGAKYVRLTANSNWGGILPQYGLSEVRFLYIPVQAREPNPDSGAIDVDVDVTLGFRAGREAAQHDVYLGTDEQAVIDGTAPATTVTEPSHGPLSLDLAQTYYWKINEVNMAETTTTWEGDLWNFATREFLVVDDFESYNDLDPDDPESRRIFNVWKDGYQQPTNGSLVGYESPPFCEQTIVHGGDQSMPLFYDNAGGAAYSEAELSLSPAQDWTKSGIQSLVLYFYGDAGNTGGQLYVKINNVKVPFDGNTTAISRPFWTQWNIDLATVGTNLAVVNTLSIGIDGAGVQGVLYVDSIQLYRQAPEVLVPQNPGIGNLVAHYAMENNTQDGSGNSHHGTPVGAPVYAPGIAGMALDFDGVDDRLDLGSLDVAGSGIALSLWVKPESYMYDDTRLISKATSTSANDHWWMLSTSGNNHVLRFRLKTNDGANTTTLVADSGGVSEGQWTHAAATWDGSMMRIYQNLQEVGSTAKGGTAVAVDASINAAIGNQPPGAGDKHWVGLIDEVRIHNRGLSEAELLYVASSQ
jgi:hypothetical protein